MEKVTAKDLSIRNPDLFEKIKDAFNLVLPQIKKQVAMTLENQPRGTVAVHATFLRIEDDKTKAILFIEMQMEFAAERRKLAARLSDVIFYDTFEQYEKARIKVIADSTKKFGGGFPAVQDFEGKNIGTIPDNENL